MEEFDYISATNSKKLRKIINDNLDAILQIDITTKDDGHIVGRSAYNCINSILSRMDAIIKHLNGVVEKMAKDKDVFALYDFLNQAQTLVDCIYKLARIFRTNLQDITKKSDIFNELGEQGTGSDDSYFRYIRSLCSVHPFDTTKHGEYQKYLNEWCPTVRRKFSFDEILDTKLDPLEVDFIAVVYSEDFLNSRFIYLSISSLLRYINRKVDFIAEIIAKITIDLEKRIRRLRKEQMLTILDFKNDAVKYLEYLAVEGKKRYADERYISFALAVFRTTYPDLEQNKKLQAYQKKLFSQIISYHELLQQMQFEPTELFYFNETIESLYNLEDEINLNFKSYKVSKELAYVLKQLEKELKKGKTKKELDILAYELIEFTYKDKNKPPTLFDMARIELKKWERDFILDYSQDNWHLFLNYLITTNTLPNLNK